MELGPISETKGHIEKHGKIINSKEIKKEKLIGVEMKKVGFIVLAVVLALGLVGAAYAWASQSMTVSGYAMTGTASIEFVNGGQALGPYYNAGDMVYGQTQGTVGAGNFDVQIYNAYSNATVQNIPFTVQNNGTVPVVVSGGTVTSWNGYPASTVTVTPPAGQINVGATGVGYVSVTLPSNFDAFVNGGGDNAPVFTLALAYSAP